MVTCALASSEMTTPASSAIARISSLFPRIMSSTRFLSSNSPAATTTLLSLPSGNTMRFGSRLAFVKRWCWNSFGVITSYFSGGAPRAFRNLGSRWRSNNIRAASNFAVDVGNIRAVVVETAWAIW